MAQVTYDPTDPLDAAAPTTTRGHTFWPGKSVSITDEKVLEKLKGNPHFSVKGHKPEPVAAADDEPRHVNLSLVEIPGDWRDLSADEVKDIGSMLNGEPVKSKAEAVKLIETELDRREYLRSQEHPIVGPQPAPAVLE